MSKRVRFCDECESDREVTVLERPATYTFRKEPFEIIEKYCRCNICGSDVSDEELDSQTLKQLSKLYETKHSINPEMIKEIRHSYGFTQQIFAKILHWGIASVKRYETGASVPDATHINILKMLKHDSSTIQRFYDQAREGFSEDERNMIEGKFREIFTSDDLERTSFELIHLNYGQHENGIETGNAKFHIHKFFNMVLFFAQQGIAKTKLMKLLWYSDFLMYKRTENPISGAPYWHFPYGPVPKNHELVLGCLEGLNLIEINEEIISNGYIQNMIESKHEFDETFFSHEELSVMKYVQVFFQGYGSVAISDFAHRERGWRETSDRQIIAYSYAKDLQLQ